MIRATQNHKSIVVRVLSRAFCENQSVNYVVRQGFNRNRRIEQLIEYSFDVCLAFGNVWITDDEKGCALVLYPDKKTLSLKTIWWDLNLVVKVIGFKKVIAVMKREAMVKSFHPRRPFCYLWFIGVSPEDQRKGIGGGILNHIVKESENENRSIYLETSVDSNLPWYKKFGFEVFHTLELSYKLYLIRKR